MENKSQDKIQAEKNQLNVAPLHWLCKKHTILFWLGCCVVIHLHPFLMRLNTPKVHLNVIKYTFSTP